MRSVGVLALQGAFEAHLKVLSELGIPGLAVRTEADLDRVHGLILPGGESSTQLRLLRWQGLDTSLRERIHLGLPVLGTCAGLILLAQKVENPEQVSLGLLDVRVCRNGYGRQLDSFESTSDEGRKVIFIRAPKIVSIGPEVRVVDSLQGEPICVRQGSMIAASFHPELGTDRSLYQLLIGERHDA